MVNKKEKGFTLVELLAVIVILAIILVIAVPKVMSVIDDSKRATLESTAKMIASQAEKAKVQNTVLSKDKEINCEDIVKLNNIDYERCIIEFDNAGSAKVTIKGSGKFAGLNVCEGDKTNAVSTTETCNVEYGNGAMYINKLQAFKASENGLIIDDTIDKNIRYRGSNPNNYVYFNCKDKDTNNVKYGSDNYDYEGSCEVWRIIGVFEVDNGSGKLEKRVKLVRDELPIRMSFDSSAGGADVEDGINYGEGINQWGESVYEDGSTYEGADLMIMLNEYYVGKEPVCRYCNGVGQGICENDCSSSVTPLSSISLRMVDNVLWESGAQSWRKPVSLLTMYSNERGTQIGKICETSGTNEEKPLCTDRVVRTIEWTGIVGLIYPSDYAYASNDINCKNDVLYTDSTCENNNWLHPSEWYWTFSPRVITDVAASIWFVSPFSSIDAAGARNTGGVRPSLYLSSNVEIIGGNGSSEPYKLGI